GGVAMEREAAAARDGGVWLRRWRVERIGRRHGRPGLVLYPDRALIHRKNAGVIRRVVLAHQLRDAAVRADDVMRGQDAGGVLEPPDRPLEHDDRPVIDVELDRVPVTPARVVALRHRTSPLARPSTDETAGHP